MTAIDKVLSAIDGHLETTVERLFELVRIPSVSSDQAYAADCGRAADWLVEFVREIGFDARILETAGHPAVYARRDGTAAGPHVLFYGHYDVQPVDPIEKWTTAPFEPRLDIGENGVKRLLGRGMSDDKGQVFTFLEACRAWIAEWGALPVGVTLLLEGEEEAGSPSFEKLLLEQRDLLAADVVLVCDSEMQDQITPAIVTRIKGLFHDKITVRGPDRELHSGTAGGVAANPIRVLSNILSGIYDGSNRVAIPGFYNEVDAISPFVRRQWNNLPSFRKSMLEDVGLGNPVLEQGYSIPEQVWGRPVVDINGVAGGNQGAAPRSVLASEASARLSFRLVSSQVPEIIRARFRAYAKSMVPDDCQVWFEGDDGASAYTVADDNPFLLAAAKGLALEWDRQPILKGSGGAIPAVAWMKQHLDLDSILVGFALDDDAIHAPNEKYNLLSLLKGARSWARILEQIAEIPAADKTERR